MKSLKTISALVAVAVLAISAPANADQGRGDRPVVGSRHNGMKEGKARHHHNRDRGFHKQTRSEREVIYVRTAPPAPHFNRTMFRHRPGMVWVEGFWSWSPRIQNYVWVEGHFEPVRMGAVWVPGNWVLSPRGWHRVPGHWAMR